MAKTKYVAPWQTSGPDPITRAVDGTTIGVSAKKRTVTACWSNECKDHYNTAFVMRGIDTSNFADNPVVLYEHGHSPLRHLLPVGNATAYGVEKHRGRNALIGTAEFWDDEFSEARFQDYAKKRMRGWSVKLIPIETPTPPTAAECRVAPDWIGAEWILRKSKLIEVSAVSCPGNATTLSIEIGRGLAGMTGALPSIKILDRAEVIALAEGASMDDVDTAVWRRVGDFIYRKYHDRIQREIGWIRAAAREALAEQSC